MIRWKLVFILLCLSFIVLIYLTNQFHQQIFFSNDIHSTNSLRTLVFIHIQKTAGSAFERSIVRRLHFGNQSSCQCPFTNRTRRIKRKLRCNCSQNQQPWLISRFSVGWLCGVHADWSHYHRCLPTRLNLEYGFYPRKYDSWNLFLSLHVTDSILDKNYTFFNFD